MDFLILIISLASFSLFLVIHVSIFRFIKSSGVMKWLMKGFLFAGLFHFAIWGLVFVAKPSLFIPYSTSILITAAFISFILYCLLTFSFVFAVFGITVTSIRIQLLIEIAKAGTKEISTAKILKRYNRDTIVKTRLTRLIEGGELRCIKGEYFQNRRFSYFLLHTYLLVMVNKLYKKSGYKL